MNEKKNDRPSLDEYDEEVVYPERYPNKVLTAIGKGIKWFFCGLAALVFIVMIWRINAMESLPRNMRTLTVTEATYQAYRAAQARGERLEMLTQGEIDPISTNDEAYGYFWVASSVVIPEAEQLQLVVRYNNSTLEHLADDFKLGEIPSREEEVLALRLRVISDATPEDPSDDDEPTAQTSEILLPTGEPVSAQQDVYNFRRYVFDGVTMGKDTIGLCVEFFYVGQAEDEEPLAQLYVWYQGAQPQTVKLTKNDITALNEFGEK